LRRTNSRCQRSSVCGETGNECQRSPAQKPAGRRQQEAITTPQWQAAIPAEHAQLVPQDENLDLARDLIGLAAPGQQAQQTADGEIDKREQH